MKFCIFLYLFFSFCNSVAQDTSACFFDEQLSLTREKQSRYQGKMIEHPHGWEAFAYYRDGNILMHG